ncbi:DUF7878 domain-containing protein [Hymenobacter cellulosivorans]|uniref:DUF7878 domain-containing protein n=1 Tax=Hymenobacter cellulosivorans TaxID=2932249 RepID=A0ABY4F778_9BACT|nr:hypothetical protein [Hymenobacter cellulosivorans]UOQ52521.1 hypothetical protein MUN80_22565 [Hymenobacter cellulosivorans]
MELHHKIENLVLGAPWLLERKNQYAAFCSIEADFEFWIDAEQVFQEPHWNIGELAVQLAEWHRSGLQGDFHYQCMDAEEQDLFTFRHEGAGFQFFSEWASNNTFNALTREALIAFIIRYRNDVIHRIESDLKYTTRLYLGQ